MRNTVLLMCLVVCTIVATGCLGQDQNGSPQVGILAGRVTIGPICPVERLNVTCPVPPEAYAVRKIVVYRADGASIVQVVGINATGYYQTTLNPGTYVVDINHIGIDRSATVPQEVTIRAGETIVLNIDVDTGIR